jgi:2-oxoglutarate decarboxylase
MVAEATAQVVMPPMGDSVSEGTILEWRKSEGDHVTANETIVEISTDKVDAEVAAPIAGTVVKIHAAAGETVAVGALLAEIDPNGDAPTDDATPSAGAGAGVASAAAPSGNGSDGAGANGGAPEATATTIDIVTPAAGESVTEGTILDWTVKVGDSVAAGDTIVEISTDKVDVELPAPAAGTITELLVAAGDTVTVGQVIGRMTSSASGATTSGPAPAGAQTPAAPAPAQPAAASEPASDGAHASPVARRAAAALHVELGSLAGSGRAGRIVKDDVLAAAEHRAAATAARPPQRPRPSCAAGPRCSSTTWRRAVRSRRRRAFARSSSASSTRAGAS